MEYVVLLECSVGSRTHKASEHFWKTILIKQCLCLCNMECRLYSSDIFSYTFPYMLYLLNFRMNTTSILLYSLLVSSKEPLWPLLWAGLQDHSLMCQSTVYFVIALHEITFSALLQTSLSHF